MGIMDKGRFDIIDYTSYTEAMDLGTVAIDVNLGIIEGKVPTDDFTAGLKEASIINLKAARRDLMEWQRRLNERTAHADK